MRITIKSIITILAVIAAFTYLNMGADHSIRPLIAYPIALAMFMLACTHSKLLKSMY